MFRPAVSVFIFCAVLVLAQGGSFKRIDVNHGRIVHPERLLEGTAKTTLGFSDTYSYNAAVKVDFGADFRTAKGIDPEVPTELLVLISTSKSGFVKGSSYWKEFTCEANEDKWCVNDNPSPSSSHTFYCPFFQITSGHLVTAQYKIITNDGTEPWKLKNKAILAGSYVNEKSEYFESYHVSNTNNKAYGWIGLGIDGDSVSNFAATEPIFSVYMSSSSRGSIIFGKDETKYSASAVSNTLETDNSWTMHSKAMSLGSSISNSAWTADVIFDMNYQWIGIPNDYKYEDNTFYKMLTDKLSMTYDSTTDSYIYKGELKTLPNLEIQLTNGKSISIPSVVYMKPVAGQEGQYSCLIKTLNKVTHGGTDTQYVVLGVPFLTKYYTVFEKTKEGKTQATTYSLFSLPTNPENPQNPQNPQNPENPQNPQNPQNPETPATPKSNLVLYIIIGVVVALLILVILLKGKKTSAGVNVSKKPSTGLELR